MITVELKHRKGAGTELIHRQQQYRVMCLVPVVPFLFGLRLKFYCENDVGSVQQSSWYLDIWGKRRSERLMLSRHVNIKGLVSLH